MTDPAPTNAPAAPGRWPPMRLFVLLLGLTAVRLLVAAVAGLTDDEAYYRLWSLDLRTGYYDHAPMIAWWIRAGRELVGDGELGVRLLAPLSTLVGSLLLWRTVALLDGAATAARATIWFNAMILIGAGSVLVTPDTPSVFFWGATLWALAELQVSRRPAWWLVVGIMAGLGLCSKYSVLFLGIGLVTWLAASRDGRRWFAAWQLWVGGAIALALFAPVVAWNATHEWISFAKQFGRTVPHGWHPEKLAETIGVQMLLIGLPLVPLVGVGIAASLGAWRRNGGDAALLPIATGLPFVAYLLFHALHGSVEGNWPAPLYPSFAWLAARAIPALPELRPRLAAVVARAARLAAPVGFGLTALLYLHVTVPVLILPAGRDPTAQMRGWDDFAREVEAARVAAGASWIAVPSYALVGQLGRRLGTDRVVQINERLRWDILPPPDPAMLAKPALFVARARSGRDGAASWRTRFATIEDRGLMVRGVGDRPIERYEIHRFADPIGPALDPVR